MVDFHLFKFLKLIWQLCIQVFISDLIFLHPFLTPFPLIFILLFILDYSLKLIIYKYLTIRLISPLISNDVHSLQSIFILNHFLFKSLSSIYLLNSSLLFTQFSMPYLRKSHKLKLKLLLITQKTMTLSIYSQ